MCIKSCSRTVDDKMLAMKIFKPDVESFKEKDCMTKPTYVVADVIKIPREIIAAQEEVDLYIATFFINFCHSWVQYPEI